MRTAIYLRIEKGESSSVEEQRSLLFSYIDSQKDLERPVKEYVDEGFSGEDFNRPGFRSMIEDAKKGEFEAILVTELARFGSDFRKTGDYLDKIFPMLQLRFLAVKDRYDSQNRKAEEKGDLLQMMYGRSLSKKQRTKRKDAENLVSSQVPFGYVKDLSHPGKWKIDPEAAKIIRTMFELAAKGWTTTQIAHYLNDNQMPTPVVYNNIHKNQGKPSLVTRESERLWSSSGVSGYLKKYEYTGARVTGKRKALTGAEGTVRVQDPKLHSIVLGVNEGIVSEELFQEAQNAIRERQKSLFVRNRHYVLKGKVRCGTCKRCMSYADSGTNAVFFCSSKTASGGQSGCSGERFSAESIGRSVLSELKNYLAKQESLAKGEEQRSLVRSWCEALEAVRELSEELGEIFIKDVYVFSEESMEIEFVSIENVTVFPRDL